MKKLFLLWAVVFCFFASSLAEAINVEERNKLVETFKQKVNQVYCSVWNNDQSYAASSIVDEQGYATLVIDDIDPGIFRLLVTAQWNNNAVFYGKAQANVRKGQTNEVTVDLSLYEWLPLSISLPDKYLGPEKEFEVKIKQNSSVYSTWFEITEDKMLLQGNIPLTIAQKIILNFDGKDYNIDLDKAMESMNSGVPLELSDCSTEEKTSLITQTNFRKNYLVVPDDYPTIQQAIDNAQEDTIIEVSCGTYYEQIILEKGVTIVGNIFYPNNVVITSDKESTVKGKTSGTLKLSGVTIENTYSGKRIYTSAAISSDLGYCLDLDHCIIKSTGTADVISANYSRACLNNCTLVGTGEYNGISYYNSGSDNKIKNCLFYNLDQAIQADNDLVDISDSLFWQTEKKGDIIPTETNVLGDPEFIDVFPNYTPRHQAEVIQTIIMQSNNYPGAVMPLRYTD